MARYRSKDPHDLTWNRIRRQITRDLDTAIMNWREETLEKLLTPAFQKYAKALETGTEREVEAEYSTLVNAVVSNLTAPPELERAVEDDT